MGKNKAKGRGAEHPLYNAYRITSPAHEAKVVFAAGIWSAVGVLLQWRVANGIGDEPFTLDRSWASRMTGVARQHIDDARPRCRGPGLGTRYRADAGWGIASPINDRDDRD